MNIEFKKFCDNIRYNESISYNDKKELLNFVKGHLFSYVKAFTSDDFITLNNILKDCDFSVHSFERFLDIAYKVKNAIRAKNNDFEIVPNTVYVFALHTLFKSLNIDLWEYDYNCSVSNVAFARGVHKLIFDNGLLNNEISLIDLTNKIYNNQSYSYNSNNNIPIIIKNLLRIEKGFIELEEKYTGVFTSDEIVSLFENVREIDGLNLSDLMKQYYPIFNNELFDLIKKAVNNASNNIYTEYVFGYLENVVSRRLVFEKQKEKIISEVERIDVNLENNVEQTFSNLISSIENRESIDKSIRNNIIRNIKEVFEDSLNNQIGFINGELDKFIVSCSSFVNDLVIPSSSNSDGVDELINVLLSKCKNFFIEYDSKKFKSIVDYILENTNISIDQLKNVGDKCAEFFKDADVSKLKAINSSLKEFKNYICKNFKDNDFIDDIFETIVVNNPELLLENNNLDEILKFLKGEVSLGYFGDHYSNFVIKKGILSYEFFRKIKEDNYRLLLSADINKFKNNLHHLEAKCSWLKFDFTKFNFNENVIYTLLNYDLFSENYNTLEQIKNLFDVKDFNKLLELNPHLLMIDKSDLESIVIRSILNENDDYNFYDLLSSELYFYRVEDYRGKGREELLDKDFNYIDLGFNNSREYDVMDILTSELVESGNSSDVWDKFNERRSQKDSLLKLLDILKENTVNDSSKLYKLVEQIVDLYNLVYSKVPNVTFKNFVIDVINDKKERLEYEIEDKKEELEEKEKNLSVYKLEGKETDLVNQRIRELILEVSVESVRDDLVKFLTKFKEERSNQKYSDTINSIKQIENDILLLEKQVERLNYLFSIIYMNDGDYVVEEALNDTKSFSIEELDAEAVPLNMKSKSLEEALDGKNLIIFADQIDLSVIPNDRNFIDKIYKFLGDGDFSISSPNFMRINALNREFVEKFTDHRSEIFSRRESRTPVRVYFIPVKNKYFDCYYVVGVNYKDHNHLDGGCSNDEVYNRRLREVKEFESFINKLGEENMDKLIGWVCEIVEQYNYQMSPIVSKIDNEEKKRSNKK